MLRVFHYTLCPFSRMLRMVLKEKKIDFELIEEPFWERRVEFLQLSPSGQTPVILNVNNNQVLASCWSIFEYLEDIKALPLMLPECLIQKSYVRYIVDWFCNKFYNEVTRYILNEKIIKRLHSSDSPNSNLIRVAKKNIVYHLNYISYLLAENNYICGEKITLADYAASAQLSTLDYIGDIVWDHNYKVKSWYALIKSRPSFKPILEDEVMGIKPPHCYKNPDF